MDQRFSMVTLGVADMAASVAFYEALGWRRSPPLLESVAFFQGPGVILSLYGWDALAADAGLAAPPRRPDPGGFHGASLAYLARDKAEVDAVTARARAAGARILKQPQDAFWGGYHAYFADPDGHLWEPAWNPGVDLDAEGRASLKGA